MSKIDFLAKMTIFSQLSKLVAILSMTSLRNVPSILVLEDDLKLSKTDCLFLTYTTLPSYREVLGITISHLEGN